MAIGATWIARPSSANLHGVNILNAVILLSAVIPSEAKDLAPG